MFYVFMLVSEQTAIISVANFNQSHFYNRDGLCLLRDTNWIFQRFSVSTQSLVG
jgi:hypothetical protein